MSPDKGGILRKILSSPWTWGIVLLIVIRVLSVQLAFENIPFTNVTNGVFEDGGDGVSYYRITNQILNGDFNYEPHFIGFFIFLAPILKIAGHDASFIEISKLMAWVNGVGLYVMATILVWLLAWHILKSKKLAHVTSAIFLIYPYIFYYLFELFGSGSATLEEFRISRFTQLNFLNVLSDPLSAVLGYASLALLLYIVIRERKLWVYVLTGFLLSFFVITRTQNVFALLLFVPALLILKRYKGFIYFALAGLPLGILQLVANYLSGGSTVASPYSLYYGGELHIQMFSLKYPLRLITYPLDHIPFLLLIEAVLVVLILYGLWKLIKEDKKLGLLVSGHLFFNIVPLLFIESVMRNPRYFLTVIPIVFIISMYSLKSLYLNYDRVKIKPEKIQNQI